VTQRTGEDWRGVSLRLSTGVPRAANMVDPGRGKCDRAAGVSGIPRHGGQLQGGGAQKHGEAAPARAEEPKAEVAEFQTQFSTEFEVPGAWTSAPTAGR